MEHEEILTLRAERAELRRTVSFFASVIKSGEPWTDECERIYQAVMNHMPLAAGNTPDPPAPVPT